MSKSKPRAQSHAGVFKSDSVKDVAEALNITISEQVASALASDVEYRIHQVVQEAARFMRHGRRTTMTTSDIDQALRVLNIEPLYGHTPHNPPVFRRAGPQNNAPGSTSVYFLEDEEIDFDRVLREEKIALPKGVNWAAHWLAVEGVQPLIPENPPQIPRESDAHVNGVPDHNRGGAKKPQQPQQLVKQVLSKELQLYYTRLTASLLPPNDTEKRTAALASLRQDAGLQALLPYLIRWVGEGVVTALKGGPQGDSDGRVLEVLLDVMSAIMENKSLFIEPYLHQILPPILSTLLHSSLPPSHATLLRTSAAQSLSRLLTQHSTTYPSLSPRIMKTLLLALISPGKSAGTREGSIRGLVGVGKEAVRKGLVDGGGAKVVASEFGDSGALVDSVMGALGVLRPPSDMTDGLDLSDPADVDVATRLRDVLGDFFADKLIAMGDAAWARAVLNDHSSS